MGDCYYHGSYYGHTCRYCSGELVEKEKYVEKDVEKDDFIDEINKIKGIPLTGISKKFKLSDEEFKTVIRNISIKVKEEKYYYQSFKIYIDEDGIWISYKYDGNGNTSSYLGNYKQFL